MKNLLALVVLVSLIHVTGCSASLIEKLSSGSLQWKEDTRPTLRVGAGGTLMVPTRGVLTNPLDYAINARLSCGFMQNDDVVHVAAHRERYLLLTAPKTRAGQDTCVLAEYEAADQ